MCRAGGSRPNSEPVLRVISNCVRGHSALHRPVGATVVPILIGGTTIAVGRVPNRLSYHLFVANRGRLPLFVLAYNLGNFLRRLCLPKAVKHWSLRSVQVKLIKMGGYLLRHARWLIF